MIYTRNRIKEVRKERKMTLDYVTQETGIARTSINNYENFTTNPPACVINKLAKLFKVDPAYLSGADRYLSAEVLLEKVMKLTRENEQLREELRRYQNKNVNKHSSGDDKKTERPKRYRSRKEWIEASIKHYKEQQEARKMQETKEKRYKLGDEK